MSCQPFAGRSRVLQPHRGAHQGRAGVGYSPLVTTVLLFALCVLRGLTEAPRIPCMRYAHTTSSGSLLAHATAAWQGGCGIPCGIPGLTAVTAAFKGQGLPTLPYRHGHRPHRSTAWQRTGVNMLQKVLLPVSARSVPGDMLPREKPPIGTRQSVAGHSFFPCLLSQRNRPPTRCSTTIPLRFCLANSPRE